MKGGRCGVFTGAEETNKLKLLRGPGWSDDGLRYRPGAGGMTCRGCSEASADTELVWLQGPWSTSPSSTAG
jgi:hypothetical protein